MLGWKRPDLSEFDIDSKNGFLRGLPPISKLTNPKYEKWELCVKLLPDLITANHVKQFVDENIPVLSIEELQTAREKRRALAVLSFIGHAYVFEPVMIGEKPNTKIPIQIGKPWYELGKLLDEPTVIRHANLVLANWFSINSNKPLNVNNLGTHNLFLGGQDERWFFTITMEIEAQGGPILDSILDLQECIYKNNIDNMIKPLNILINGINTIRQIFKKMPKKLDPHIFYHRVRHFLNGFDDKKLFPNGLIFDQVENENGELISVNHSGGSAAQSSLIASIDAALNIVHNDKFLTKMLNYMPKQHRNFIKFIRNGPKLSEYFEKKQNLIKQHESYKLYQKAINCMKQFRTEHIIIVSRYIVIPAAKANKKTVGTGGSSVVPYLKKLRDNTVNPITTGRLQIEHNDDDDECFAPESPKKVKSDTPDSSNPQIEKLKEYYVKKYNFPKDAEINAEVLKASGCPFAKMFSK